MFVSARQQIAAALILCGAISAAAADAAPGPTMPNTIANCNKWFLANDGDSCATAQAAGGISATQFFEYNPDVSKDCLTNFWPTYYYCIGLGPELSSSSSSVGTTTTKTTSSSSTSAPLTSTTSVNATYSIRNPVVTWNITTPTIGTTYPPKETQAGQPSYCIDWHLVGLGETCQTVVNRYSTLTMDNLLDWNPDLLDDCSGLQINYWLCIRIQPQSSLTLTFLPPSDPVKIPDSTAYTPPTFPTAGTSFTPTPTQGALPTNCLAYYQAQDGDRCDNVLANYPMITREQFFAWNSFLASNCDGMWAGYFYCVWAGAADSRPEPPTVTTRPTAAAPSITAGCKAWYYASGGDDCELIVEIFGRFSLGDFVGWNPSVSNDCSGIQDDVYYCVAVPGTPSTRTAPLPSAMPTAAPPQQSGISGDCIDFWLVSSLDDCRSITRAKGISLEDFLTWNPAVGTTMCDHLLPDYDVCVGINGTGGGTTSTVSASITTSSSPSTITVAPTTTVAGNPVSTPTPILPGMVSGCQRFYFTLQGDGCWAISNAAGISLDDFYKWNPGAGSDCQGLWVSVYVCIGLGGPATTISGGPPVPT